MAKKKNPVLERKYWEGYEIGKRAGIAQAVDFFADRLKDLPNTPGIGEKTMEKIIEQIGHQYFKQK